MKIKIGDAVEALKTGEIKVLVHGCNCFNTMGRGIAKTIKEEFPLAFHVDHITTSGDYNKLGTITVASGLLGEGLASPTYIIVNAYTQYKYVGDFPLVDYDALRLCLRKVAHKPLLTSRNIGLPLIGCGLAGGDWDIVKQIIEDELPHATVYVLEQDRKRVGL